MNSSASEPEHVVQRIATVAWLAIGLGLAVQILIVVTKLVFGSDLPGVGFLASLAQGVTWSVVVCVGIAVGTVIMRASVTIAGVLGFVCAPLALGLARGAQRGVNELIGEPVGTVTASLALIALLKAFQYGLLGFLLARLVRRHVDRARPYLILGAISGVVFGGIIVTATALSATSSGAELTMPDLAGLTVNELLFPIGCAMVVFTAQSVARFARPAS
ncbi:hypothetical protein [Hoyosella subflava]|nr:hypothetical protein [Hoyosella subflava]